MRLALILLWLAFQAPPPRQQTFTGCVDEQDGKYVLTDDRELKPIAILHGEGASDDSFFAKEVGHKVSVQGIKKQQGDQQVIQVRKLTTISDTCLSSQ